MKKISFKQSIATFQINKTKFELFKNLVKQEKRKERFWEETMRKDLKIRNLKDLVFYGQGQNKDILMSLIMSLNLRYISKGDYKNK